MNLRRRLEEALNEVKLIDAMDGTVPYWDYDQHEGPVWRKPDKLLDALERAVLEWKGASPPGRHRKDDSSIWLG